MRINPTISVNQVRTLLRVAVHEGSYQADLVNSLSDTLAESSVSKNINFWMGRQNRDNAKIPVAIDVRPGIENRRFNEMYLTNVGEHLITELLRLINKGF